MTYLLLQAGHLIAMVCWFAGLFYLPRLFVYHAQTGDDAGRERFRVMERKLYRGIMTPSALALLVFGGGMLALNPALLKSGWMLCKLALVLGLLAYHMACGCYRRQLAEERCRKSHVFFRWFNEVPVLFLVAIVLLAVLKPF
jgi:putative membrane protein